jgi:hypothetical protein
MARFSGQKGVLAAALAVALAILVLPASAGAASPCAHTLTGGVVARLCQSGATKSSAKRKVTMHATGYWASAKRGAVELHGSTPLRTGLGVRVNATRFKGTQIQLLYARGTTKWQVRFSRLKGRGALRGKVVSSSRGAFKVRLKIGHRSIKPTSVKAILPTPPSAPVSRRTPRTAQGGGGCAVPDPNYDRLFEREGPGWTGGDGTYSVGLPDGRTAWSFGDSYLGRLNPDGSRPINTPMVNNTMVLQGGASGATLSGGSSGQPQSLVTTGESDSWFWPGASAVEGGQLVQFLAKMHRTGSGLWDFSYAGTYLARYSLPGISLQSVAAVPASDSIMWGVWVLDDGGYTYIYGIEDRGWDKYVHVARVSAGDISGQWSYYTGSSWSSDPATSARLLNGASNQFSVVKVGGMYQLITQTPLGNDINAYRALTPFGPFTTKKLLYTTPNWGENTFTYNAVAHPELSGGNEVLISFNVNSNNGFDMYTNPEIYRPRFVRAAASCF